MQDLKYIGAACKKERKKAGYTQLQVAIKLGYSPENISAFECGRNDNVTIFLWYLKNCINMNNTYEQFIKGVTK